MFKWIHIRVDGQPSWLEIGGDRYLSGLLRSLGKIGPKADCGSGSCGACVVLVGDRPVKSCSVLTEDCAGADVWTADHLDHGPTIHPMLAAFRRHGVTGCDTCMPGLMVAAIAYAARNRDLSEQEIVEDLAADVCRCGRARTIAAAVLEGAEAMHRLRPMDRQPTDRDE